MATLGEEEERDYKLKVRSLKNVSRSKITKVSLNLFFSEIDHPADHYAPHREKFVCFLR